MKSLLIKIKPIVFYIGEVCSRIDCDHKINCAGTNENRGSEFSCYIYPGEYDGEAGYEVDRTRDNDHW